MAVVPAAQPKQPVTQVFPVAQDHDDKDDHQATDRQWLQQWSDNALDELKRFELGRAYFDRYRLHRFDGGRSSRRVTLRRRAQVSLGIRELLAQVAQHFRNPMKDGSTGNELRK